MAVGKLPWPSTATGHMPLTKRPYKHFLGRYNYINCVLHNECIKIQVLAAGGIL